MTRGVTRSCMMTVVILVNGAIRWINRYSVDTSTGFFSLRHMEDVSFPYKLSFSKRNYSVEPLLKFHQSIFQCCLSFAEVKLNPDISSLHFFARVNIFHQFYWYWRGDFDNSNRSGIAIKGPVPSSLLQKHPNKIILQNTRVIIIRLQDRNTRTFSDVPDIKSYIWIQYFLVS